MAKLNHKSKKKYLCTADDKYCIIATNIGTSQVSIDLMGPDNKKIYSNVYKIPSTNVKHIDQCVFEFCEHFVGLFGQGSNVYLKRVAESIGKVTNMLGLIIWPRDKRNKYHNFGF